MSTPAVRVVFTRHLARHVDAAPDVLWCQHHNGIFKSTDGGGTWRELDAPDPAGFGFPVAVHPTDPERAWFVPLIADEERIPHDGAVSIGADGDTLAFGSTTGGVFGTADGGDSWTRIRAHLPPIYALALAP